MAGAAPPRGVRWQAVAAPKPYERLRHLRERAQFFDLRHQITDFVHSVTNSGTLKNIGHRAMTNLPIGRVLAAEQRVDHRVLEMRASPPGDKGVGISLPAFRLQKGFCYLGKPRLHVYDRSILIEHTNLDRVFEN